MKKLEIIKIIKIEILKVIILTYFVEELKKSSILYFLYIHKIYHNW